MLKIKDSLISLTALLALIARMSSIFGAHRCPLDSLTQSHAGAGAGTSLLLTASCYVGSTSLLLVGYEFIGSVKSAHHTGCNNWSPVPDYLS